jgi:hypothetical protein
MSTEQMLARLRDDKPGGPADRLAALLVDDLLERPLAELLPPAFVARAARELLAAWVDSASAEKALAAELEARLRPAANDKRTLGEALPDEATEVLLALVKRPFTPSREAVAALLEPEPVRKVIRGFLLQVVVDFGQRLRAPVSESRVARGLGGLARFAAGQAKAHSGTLGAIAGAVSDEVEHQVEKRAAEFVDSALSGILARLADDISNPANAKSQAKLRTTLVEGALRLKRADLAREFERSDVGGAARLVRKGLADFVARADAQAELEKAIAEAQRHDAQRTAREVLTEFGLLEKVRALGQEALGLRLAPVFQSPAFAAWLDELTKG